MYGSLNCNTIMELELYCISLGKWNEVRHVEAFRSLHNKMFAWSRFQQLQDVIGDLGTFSCQILRVQVWFFLSFKRKRTESEL